MILITGASGFIGTYLAKELASHRVEHVVLSDIVPPGGMMAALHKIFRHEGTDYPFEFLDISSPIDMLRLIKKYSVHTVLHCVSLRAPEAQKDPLKSLKIDVEGFINILEMARLDFVKKILYLSSIAVYGPPSQYKEKVFNEHVLPRPKTVYGMTKVFNENMGVFYHNYYQVDFTALRLSNVYGAGRTRGTTALLSIMIGNALDGKETTVSFGDQMFDWIYVEDVTAAIYQAMNSQIKNQRIFNITGNSVSMKEVIHIVKSYLPEAMIQVHDCLVSEANGIQVSPWTFDNAHVRRFLNWFPRPIEEGIRATIDTYRELKFKDPDRHSQKCI